MRVELHITETHDGKEATLNAITLLSEIGNIRDNIELTIFGVKRSFKMIAGLSGKNVHRGYYADVELIEVK